MGIYYTFIKETKLKSLLQKKKYIKAKKKNIILYNVTSIMETKQLNDSEKIILACKNHDFYKMKRLLNFGQDLNLEKKDENGDTCFLISCKNGNLKFVKFFLKAG